MRNNRQEIDEGPDWTSVYRSRRAGGDGIGLRSCLLSCAPDSESPVEYRIENPADPEGQAATLMPGEIMVIKGTAQMIHHIVMRGVGGAAIGGVEQIAH